MSDSALERDFPLASMVTRPAQHTKALELDRPELAGMVPSTIHRIPTNLGRLKFSWWSQCYGRWESMRLDLCIDVPLLYCF